MYWAVAVLFASDGARGVFHCFTETAEVARAAVLLDGVKHMVMTTGTPATPDRGAQVLCDSAFAVRAAVDLPIQGQCEPPDDDRWFARMKAAGIEPFLRGFDAT